MTTDGPFVETKEFLAGFYIFEADDLDSASVRQPNTVAVDAGTGSVFVTGTAEDVPQRLEP